MTQRDQAQFDRDVKALATEVGESLYPVLNALMQKKTDGVDALVALAALTSFCAYTIANTIFGSLKDPHDHEAVERLLETTDRQFSKRVRSALEHLIAMDKSRHGGMH